jgi:Arc/MetJ family transcription regulator
MAKTLIDLDEDLLQEAMVALGTSTKKDTVNAALSRVVEESRGRRTAALERLSQLFDEGVFNLDLLEELDK